MRQLFFLSDNWDNMGTTFFIFACGLFFWGEVVEDHGKAGGLDLHEPHGAQADRSGRRGGVACTGVGPRRGPLTVSALWVAIGETVDTKIWP